MAANFTYPPMPQGVSEEVIQPSAAFKTEVFRVLGAILFFVVSYFALMGLALGFAAICILSAYFLVTTVPKFFTLMIGLGLVGLGVMVVYFMIKFVFSRIKTDRTGLIEVTEKEQPTLFAFIRQVAFETQTPFPKRIYLSPDVNACVFYDSGFWSMFLPIRKNLQIGLGLVNAVNISEFKAILAHEFGHFSQRSMKLGSYIYNVNRVLYNLLYDNHGFERALAKWGSASGYFYLFAKITTGVIQLMQWTLQKIYLRVNKYYSSLSREMEFHADAVAAYVSGSKHLITSLYRVEAADLCYSQLLDYYNKWVEENQIPDNLYPQLQVVMQHIGQQYKIPVENNLLQVNAQSFAFFNQSRLVIKNQWASHPSNEDREAHLNNLNIFSETIHEPAWVVFNNPEKLQQLVTAKLFEEVSFEQKPEVLHVAAFREKFSKQEQENNFDAQYKGFYDGREISGFNLDEQIQEALLENSNLVDLTAILTDEACRVPMVVASLQKDVDTLKEIAKGNTGIKNIDFDGKKYRTKEIDKILTELNQDLAQAEDHLKNLDKKLFRYFYQQALKQDKADKLVSQYCFLFELIKETEKDAELYLSVREAMYPLFTHNLTIDQANVILNNVALKEKSLKERIAIMLQDETVLHYCSERLLEKMRRYMLIEEQPYLQNETLNQEPLTNLAEVLEVYIMVCSDKVFKVKKNLLQTQLTFINTPQLSPEYSL